METILVNYNYSPDWISSYPELSPITIYDRSDDGIERNLTKFGGVYKTENKGDVDWDKLGYLVQFYDTLPEVFLWGKSNLLKYVEEDYLKQALQKREFAPLLKFDHKTYSDQFGEVCKYEGGIYKERANSWFFNNPELATKDIKTWKEWAELFHLPMKAFIPFAPGGNYILTKERVHRYSVDFYEDMRATLPYAMHPAEAHACERSYYLLWS